MCDFHNFGLILAKNQRCLKFFRIERAGGQPRSEKKLKTMLILVFEIIVQPPKTHFSTFSKVQKQKKSETKIMKISHSAQL